MIVPVEKGLEYTLEIVSTGSEGEGVGKIDNFTVFVPGAIKGETVKVSIIKVTKNYSIGKIEEIITPSENRVEPTCKIYKYCGGCNVQHIGYKAQLEMKRQKVEDAVRRIGKIEDIEILPTIGMEDPLRYRNKVILPVGKDSDKVKIGFYAPRSHSIIDMEVCDIQHIIADKVSFIVRKWATENNIAIYNERAESGNLRNIMVRYGYTTKEAMVVIVTKEKKIKFMDKLVKDITEALPEVVSIIQNVNPKNTNVVLGKQCKTIWGKDTIEDYVGDIKFSISPLSFFQVNPV
ncbi:MAG: 23S rRNA (uracil(1939)-C(5))-methyltransferase RlmD, partial [Clostridium sp.]